LKLITIPHFLVLGSLLYFQTKLVNGAQDPFRFYMFSVNSLGSLFQVLGIYAAIVENYLK